QLVHMIGLLTSFNLEDSVLAAFATQNKFHIPTRMLLTEIIFGNIIQTANKSIVRKCERSIPRILRLPPARRRATSTGGSRSIESGKTSRFRAPTLHAK